VKNGLDAVHMGYALVGILGPYRKGTSTVNRWQFQKMGELKK